MWICFKDKTFEDNVNISLQSLWRVLPPRVHHLLPLLQTNPLCRSLPAEISTLQTWWIIRTDVSHQVRHFCFISGFFFLNLSRGTSITLVSVKDGGPVGSKWPWESQNPGWGKRSIFCGKVMERPWFGKTNSQSRLVPNWLRKRVKSSIGCHDHCVTPSDVHATFLGPDQRRWKDKLHPVGVLKRRGATQVCSLQLQLFSL